MANKEKVSIGNKAVLYARVSSKDQEVEGFSIPAQRKALNEYASKENLSIVKEFCDTSTAKKAGRVEFNAMLDFLKANPSIKHILVEKTDRLLRNHKDHVLLDDLINDFDVYVHLVKESSILSKHSDSNGKLFFGMKVLMAKAFIDNLSAEVRKGMREKAEQRMYPSGAPYGYKNIRLEDGRGIIKADPIEAPFVRKIFELYATGSYSLLTLRNKMLADGMVYRKGKKIYISTLETILKNEFYTGIFYWNGKRYEKAQHEPLVSKELFMQVQNILRNPRKSKSKKGMFPFSNLFSCGVCGCALTAEIQKGKYIYYRCTSYKGNCKQPYLKQEILEHQFESLLQSIQISDEMRDAVLYGLQEKTKPAIEYRNACKQQISNQIGTLDKKLEAIYDDKVTGDITAELWKRKTSAWQEEKDELTKKLVALQNTDMPNVETATTIFELARKAPELFKSRPSDQKRRMIELLVSNCSYKDGKIDAVLKPVFQELLVSRKTGNWCARQDLNLRPAD